MNILIISAIIILIFILLYSNIKIKVNFKRHDDNDMIILNITVLYGIFTYTKQIPFVDIVKGYNNVPAVEIQSNKQYNENYKGDSKSVFNTNEIEKYIKKYKELYIKFEKLIIPFTKRLKQKVIFNEIYWNTELGIDDAANTAIITGILWSVKSTMLVFISNNFNLHSKYINVVPNYNIKTFKTSINCIFTVKLGNIINVAAKTLIVYIKDGGKK